MKFDLYDKVVDSLHDLKEQYGMTTNDYKVTLTPKDEIYMFDGIPKNLLLEVRDENTIIDCTSFDRFDIDGAAPIWNDMVDVFAEGLVKRLGHKVTIWNRRRLDLYEKVEAAVENLRENGPDHKKIVKDYHVSVSSEGHIFVYDSGTIIFKLNENKKKMISQGEYRGMDPEWDKLVNFFVDSLEEQLGYKLKVKHKP